MLSRSSCTQVVWQQMVVGTEETPPDLPPGYWFWRVSSMPAADVWTSAWLFRVRRRLPDYAPLVNTAAEPFNDFNGDGYPDAIVGGTIVFGGAGTPSSQAVGPADTSSTLPAPHARRRPER